MYEIALLFHSYIRWLVLLFMIFAVIWAWWGYIRKRNWTVWDTRFGAGFAIVITIQFMFGLILYFIPNGIAQAALQDMGQAMGVRELRFFGLEHPLQMLIALTLVHLGWTRSRKADDILVKFRWTVTTYTIATLLIVSAIPWWRPLFRSIVPEMPPTALTRPDDIVGDVSRGEALFYESIDRQPSCSTCHALDDSHIVGPGFEQLAVRAGSRVDGQSAEDYIYESIVNPQAFIVEGYANIMPTTYADVLSQQQLVDLVVFLNTLD